MLVYWNRCCNRCPFVSPEFLIWVLEQLRLCTCNVLGFGSTFYDVVLHCHAYVKSNLRVVYSHPRGSDLAYAQAIMDLTLSVRLRKLRDYYEDDVSMLEKCSTLERKTKLFLAIFNGNWKDTSQKGLVHHCFMGCPCGGLTPAALRQVAADLFVEIVLASKPSVPAVSRWLKCSKAAKWFLTLVTVTAVIVCRLLGCLLVWLES